MLLISNIGEFNEDLSVLNFYKLTSCKNNESLNMNYDCKIRIIPIQHATIKLKNHKFEFNYRKQLLIKEIFGFHSDLMCLVRKSFEISNPILLFFILKF